MTPEQKEMLAQAKAKLEHGAQYPYDRPDNGTEPRAEEDWAHRAARGILADLTDRRGVGQELKVCDGEIRMDIIDKAAWIIRAASEEDTKNYFEAIAEANAEVTTTKF